MANQDKRKGNGLRWLVVVLVLAGLLGWLGWYKLLREVPQQLRDDSMEEYYKYGSIGTENEQGIPFWIWLVLPKMFPEYLPGPGGWASIGLPWEQGRELPVGISRKTIGFERVAINCAFCHLSTLRDSPEDAPHIYPGGASTTVNSLAYQRFLFSAASDPRFTAGNILDQIGQIYEMPLLDRLLYRFVLVPATRKALLEEKQAYAWTNTRPEWGRGRIDPFNPVKVSTLGLSPGDTTGNSDMQPIWNLRPRVEGHMALHWDGLNTDLTEVVLSSAIGDGTSPKALPVKQLERLQKWLMDLPPPRFEDHFPVDQALADSGKPVFDQHCARCHAIGGEQTGQVLPLSDADWAYPGTQAGPLYTDPNRAQMWTPEAAEAYNAYADAYPWGFEHFRSTGGYVNVPLDAIWIRAPYLHNGSVPYLDELLEPPAQRSRVFYRGLDVYDPERMGFIAEGEDAQRVGTLLDTSLRGNSNQGHLWGTELPAEQTRALLEYLKTL
jgi:hypothetical protein